MHGNPNNWHQYIASYLRQFILALRYLCWSRCVYIQIPAIKTKAHAKHEPITRPIVYRRIILGELYGRVEPAWTDTRSVNDLPSEILTPSHSSRSSSCLCISNHHRCPRAVSLDIRSRCHLFKMNPFQRMLYESTSWPTSRMQTFKKYVYKQRMLLSALVRTDRKECISK